MTFSVYFSISSDLSRLNIHSFSSKNATKFYSLLNVSKIYTVVYGLSIATMLRCLKRQQQQQK